MEKHWHHIQYYGRSEQGLRENNEDCCFVDALPGDRVLLAVVADGVGGNNAGEVASEVTCRTVVDYLTLLPNPSTEDLRMAMTAANNDVIALQRNPSYENMATVASACLLSPDSNSLSIAHVGDTRIYALSSDGTVLSKLTKDHSIVGRLRDENIITEQEARTHPCRNRIDRFIGERRLDYFSDYIYTATVSLTGISRILICTDGLYDALPGDEIRSVLACNHNAATAADILVKRALNSGSHDNISLVVIIL